MSILSEINENMQKGKTKIIKQLIPRALDEGFSPDVYKRQPFGVMEGDDWFGCHWIFDEKIFGFAQDPKVPVPCTDITKWKEQVKFPDLDAIDWEGLCAPIVASYDPDRMTQLMPVSYTHLDVYKRQQ